MGINGDIMKDKTTFTSTISEITLPSVIPSNIEDEMQKAYIDYSMNVIVGRALPDVRDGLKPVHRRILYAMNDQGMTHDNAYKKSARIVGEVLGKYHPHGDCLRGDTKLFLANGTFKTIEEIYNEKTSGYDIICVSKTGKLHIAQAHSFRIGQYTNKIYRLNLSDGSKIECTSNHPFLSDSLKWIKAGNLKSGMNLFCTSIKTIENKPVNIITKGKQNLHITNISILLVDDEPMYDFTVDEYENMLIPMNSVGNQHNMICAHNSSVYDALVRMIQSFSLRYPLIDGQGNFGCFTKKTKIKLADGRNLSFGELVKEDKEGKTNYTFTVNNDGNIEIAKIKNPRLTKNHEKIMTIILDNNKKIKCTLNHKFLLLNGKYIEAHNLKSGMSLMPIYTRLSTQEDSPMNKMDGYEMVYNPPTESWSFVHHLSDKYNLEHKVYSKSEGRVRHHKDINKQNNYPENIRRMQRMDHIMLHNSMCSQRHATDAEYVRKLDEGRERFWNNEENVKIYSERMTQRNIKNWKDPEYRTEMSHTLSVLNKQYIKEHPEKRKELSTRLTKTLKSLWKNESYRKKRKAFDVGLSVFKIICKYIIDKGKRLSRTRYEKAKNKLYPNYNAVSWKVGLNNFYLNDIHKATAEISKNHKVKKLIFSNKYSDVYDLTIEKTHNFALSAGVFVHNSIDGDNAAAMRYTEARLGKISNEILEDINKNTVKFIPNYDGSLEEPSVLPCKLPNLLINGSTGIAVGMATNMPPHNLGEVVDGIIAVIDNPSLESTALMEYIKGPDFPTAAVIYGKSGIYKAYTTGRGSVKIRAVVDTETSGTREQLIVTELPYQVNKANLIETIADLVKDKKIVGISNIRDESDKDGIRIVIELSKQAYPKVVLNKLFSSTNLETSFSIINLALVDGKPKVMALKELISNYISHRKEIIIKRSEFDLDKAKQRGHILEGLNIAISKIDTVISALKIAKSTHDAQIKLVEKLEVSTKQAKAILDMKLHKITRLEHDNIDKEYKEIETTISKLKELLSDEKNVLNVIKSELLYLKEKFSNERRTKIVEDTGDFSTEDLIPKVNNVIMITKTGYIKRLEVDSYRQQRRGGKGVLGMDTKEEDIVSDVFIANSHEYIMFFTDMGKVYWLKVYSIPSLTKQAKGTAIINIVQLEKDEQITAYIPVKKFDDKHFLVMVTKNGTIKKVNLDKFSHPRTTGIYAISLDEGDKLISVKLTNGNDHILIGTKHGQAIRFKESILRPTGRTAYGVIGMKLHGKDKVISMDIVKKGCSLLTVSENGYGKRTNFSEYRVTNRGGTGIITINTDERNGDVVDIRSVKEDDEIIVSTASGITIRVPVKGITLQGRATSGVRIMRVDKGDKVVGVAPLAKESDINMKE